MAVRIVVALAVLLAGLGFLLLAMTVVRRRAVSDVRVGPSGRRIIRSRQPSEPGPPPPAVHAPVPDTPEVQVNRRLFLNRAWLLAMSVFGVAFGGTSVAMLWPNKIAGFGAKINAGNLADILKTIETDGRYYNPDGSLLHRHVPAHRRPGQHVREGGRRQERDHDAVPEVRAPRLPRPVLPDVGVVRVPVPRLEVQLRRRAACPGSPAPAGLWRFPIEITDGEVIVDTSGRDGAAAARHRHDPSAAGRSALHRRGRRRRALMHVRT